MSSPAEKDHGTYTSVLKRMLDSLASAAIRTGEKVLHPLARFNRTASHDFTFSLLSGWAVIADIANFYRNRITDEGYLKSALEDRSIFYLGQLLGYRRWQGEAAGTWLALTVSSTSLPQESAGTGIVQIPAGGNLVVQNIPSSGSQPVVFESHDAAEARVEWNKLLPFTPTPPQAPTVFDGMAGLRLSGQVTSLRPGSPLLIQTLKQSFFRTIDQVQAGQDTTFTLVTWTEPLKVDDPGSNRILSVSTFRQQAGFFGRKAQAWKSAPDSVRQDSGTRSGGILSRKIDSSAWTSIQNNLPPQLVQALAVGPDSRIYAGTSNGLYTAASPGAEWIAVTTNPGRQNVQSFFRNDLDFLYAGGTHGSVSFSADGGQSWQSLRGPVYTGDDRLDRGHGLWYWFKRLLHMPVSPEPKPSSAQASQPALDGVIRALAECTYERTRFLFAGTDRGIFFLPAGGLYWTTYNNGLPGYNSDTGLSGTVVLALCPAPEVRSSAIYAGTESGLYVRALNGTRWKQVDFPNLTTQPKVLAFANYNRRLFAATSQGLYSSTDGNSWHKEAGAGLPENTSFRSLAPYSHELSAGLLAGTDRGAYLTCDGGATWKPLACQKLPAFCLNLGFVNTLDQCDLSVPLRAIFAANGVRLPADAAIEVVAEGSAWSICSASQGESSCFGFSLTQEASSIQVRQIIPLSDEDVHSVACLPTGEFLLASPTGEFLESEWPGFHLCCPVIALDRIISDLQSGSIVVIHQDQPQPVTVIATVEDIEQRPVQAWGRQATVSVLRLKNLDGQLELLRQRDAVIYCKSNPLAASALEDSALTPITGQSVSVRGALASLRVNTPIAITGQPPSAVLPAAGGVFLHHPADANGSKMKQPPLIAFGLEQESIQALTSGGGYLWAAVENAGIYLHDENTTTADAPCSAWQPLSATGAPSSVQCLLWFNDSLWAGTGGDYLYQCTQKQDVDNGAEKKSWAWTQDTAAPANILALIADSAGTLYAGTPDKGIFRKVAGASEWVPLSSTTPLTDIYAFAIGPDKNSYAGAAQGVFRLNPNSVFEPVTPPPAPQAGGNVLRPLASVSPACYVDHVTALAFEQETLYAGTAGGGVFSLPAQSSSWVSVSAHRLTSPISAIVFSSAGIVLAGTRGAGLCRLSATDGVWTPVEYSASNDIIAVLTLPTGYLLVAASNASILSNGGDGLKAAGRNFLFLAPVNFSAMLDLQVVPQNLTAMFQRRLSGFTNPRVSTQQRGQSWIIRSGTLSFLLHVRDHGLPTSQIAVDQIDTFLALSREADSMESCARWTLSNGFSSAEITLAFDAPQIFLAPAMPGSKPASEVAEISNITLSETTEATTIQLKETLTNLYDPNVTALNANLAYATQGITVLLEVLGSGDATKAHQSFQLRRPPVTYARPQPKSEVACSLLIQVNASSSPNAPLPSAVAASPIVLRPSGEIWTQAPSFFGVAPGMNAYTLTLDSEGNDIVQFGNGLQGARLPTGMDNVTAGYRTGLGTHGNIDAGALIVFRKRPLGIRSVSNPVPARNGSDPETAETARRQMKHWTSSLDRIVCLQDYADFCLARPDILKAQVTQLDAGADKSQIHITLAARDRLPVDPSGVQGKAIQHAIEAAAARTYPFTLAGFTTLYFRLKTTVTVATGSDQESIRQDVIHALRETFSFDRRSFAENVTATEVIAVIQRVRGVQGLYLQALYITGELPGYFIELVSQPARWDAHHATILSAQLLLFDPAPDAAVIEFQESA